MNIIFEVNIRGLMIEDIEQEQAWIAKVKDRFPDLAQKHLDQLNEDNKMLEAKKAEIDAEIEELMEGVA